MGKKPQIRIETWIDAPPAEVWKAITDSTLASEWLVETNIRPEKGFRAYFKMKPMPGFDGNISAEVLEVKVNELFVYTWQSSWMKKPTTIRFSLRAERNVTQLLLEHWGFEGLLGGLPRTMMSGGWKKMITERIPRLIQKQK